MTKSIAVAFTLTFIAGCNTTENADADTERPDSSNESVSAEERREIINTDDTITILLPNGALPDSNYVPAALPERYYSETVPDLIPSDSYGRIWPYIGGLVIDIMTWSLQ